MQNKAVRIKISAVYYMYGFAFRYRLVIRKRRNNKYMDILKAMLLGAVQGFSEFFPISSSGHLHFFTNLFNIGEYTVSFDILINAACLIALVFVFYRDLIYMFKNPTSHFNKMIGISLLPIFAVSVLFQNKIDEFFYNSKALGVCFIFTGAVIFYETMYRPGKKHIKNMNIKDSLIIGGFQAVGVVPAVSRNALALCGGLQSGMNPKAAVKYAYIMSIPAILGRIVWDLVKIYKTTGTSVTDVFGVVPMLFAFMVTLICAVVAIRVMQRLAAKGKFRGFAYYLWAIGLITLIDMLAVNKIF